MTRPAVLRRISYGHSTVYLALLYFALFDRRHHEPRLVLGWAHGLLWIAMSLLCLAAVRRRSIPFWLGVVVAVVGGVGPFAGSIAFFLENRRLQAGRTGAREAMLGGADGS